jgi:hypothetical protein
MAAAYVFKCERSVRTRSTGAADWGASSLVSSLQLETSVFATNISAPCTCFRTKGDFNSFVGEGNVSPRSSLGRDRTPSSTFELELPSPPMTSNGNLDGRRIHRQGRQDVIHEDMEGASRRNKITICRFMSFIFCILCRIPLSELTAPR